MEQIITKDGTYVREEREDGRIIFNRVPNREREEPEVDVNDTAALFELGYQKMSSFEGTMLEAGKLLFDDALEKGIVKKVGDKYYYKDMQVLVKEV